VVGRAVAGAALAGVLVGVGEAVIVTLERHLGLDAGLFFFAFLFYGGIGALIGLGIGIALRVATRASGALAFGLAGAVVLAVLATIIGRFRVFRDVFNETFDGAPLSPMMFQVASIVGAVVVFVVAFLALRELARRAPGLASPLVVLGALAVALVVSRAGLAMSGKDVPPPPVKVGAAPERPARHLDPRRYAPRRPPLVLRREDEQDAGHRRTRGGRDAVRARVLPGLVDAPVGRDHFQLALSVLAPRHSQVGRAPGRGRDARRGDAGGGLFHGRVREQHQRRATLRIPAGLRPVHVPRAGVLLRRDRVGGAAHDIQHAPPDPRALRVAEEVGRELLPAGRRRDEHGLDWIASTEPSGPSSCSSTTWSRTTRTSSTRTTARPTRASRTRTRSRARRQYRSAYDGAIRFLDDELAKLFTELKTKGLYDNATILFTADHGEEFHEHGGWWHGTTLYDEQLAVPLIVKPRAGGATGVVSDALVSSLDVAPTLIAAAGVAVPPAMAGKPLGLAADAPSPRDHSFAESELEGNSLQAYRSGGMKVIHANPGNPRGLPEHQLFDVASDPGEQKDLISTQSDAANKLTADMSAVQSHAESIAVRSTGTSIDAASEERLRALDTCTDRPRDRDRRSRRGDVGPRRAVPRGR
jgi:hypothetical protein